MRRVVGRFESSESNRDDPSCLPPFLHQHPSREENYGDTECLKRVFNNVPIRMSFIAEDGLGNVSGAAAEVWVGRD